MAQKKNPAAVSLGRLGGKARASKLTPEELSEIGRAAGKVGGAARAKKLSPEERRKIAQKAGKAGAAARWRDK
jgi:hypothetical protein